MECRTMYNCLKYQVYMTDMPNTNHRAECNVKVVNRGEETGGEGRMKRRVVKRAILQYQYVFAPDQTTMAVENVLDEKEWWQRIYPQESWV